MAGGVGQRSLEPEILDAPRHDPAELYLRLDDLWTNPRRLSPVATRRDTEELVTRLLAAHDMHMDSAKVAQVIETFDRPPGAEGMADDGDH